MPEKTLVESFAGELENFESIAAALRPMPNDLPTLEGIEVGGRTLALNGGSGGDHIVYIDFDRRCDLPERIRQANIRGRFDIMAKLEDCKKKAGILIADVSGHKTTDAFVAGMLHQAFLTGVLYELEDQGTITPRLFEHLSVRFHDSMAAGKYITVLYGEIDSSGRFRFISAGHQIPLVFSHLRGSFMEISPDCLYQCPPLGMMPFEHIDRTKQPRPPLGFKRRYEVNVLNLIGSGDMLLLCTDGVTDHASGKAPYIDDRLEAFFRAHKDRPIDEFVDSLAADIREFAPLHDDASFVVVRKGR
ncbi:MAG TPA: PP2C family protein-serine/threonine phosphatase [Vicinamibacteria bacterium]|nr:PP2C family protein-serine/threonine phosphatase [Vicinamibacteria bacterium]